MPTQPEPDPPACLPGEDPLLDVDAFVEASRAFIAAADKAPAPSE